MDTDALLGSSIGRYRVNRLLGEGGMAVVYQAFDPQLDRNVAIKVLKLDQIDQVSSTAAARVILKRFEHEARALARLQHPNIVPIIEFGITAKQHPYLVMPLLSGGTLKSRIRQAVPVEEAARLLAPIAEALAYAHSIGIIHRDIKPSNILLTQSGDPMLTDFGIARLLFLDKESLSLTASGAFIGTPAYMAPEQWNGKTLPQSDIYALSLVFYELVTGRNPYAADTPQQIMYKQFMEPLPSPRQFIPDLPTTVEEAIVRGLAREPENRFPGIKTFAAILRQFAAGNLAPNRSVPADAAVADEDRTAAEAPSIAQPQKLARTQETEWTTPTFGGTADAELPVESRTESASSGALLPASRELKTAPTSSAIPLPVSRRSRWLLLGIIGSAAVLLLIGAAVLIKLIYPIVQPAAARTITAVAPVSTSRATTTLTLTMPVVSTATIRPSPTAAAAVPVPSQTSVPATATTIPVNLNLLWDCSYGPADSHDGGKYDLNGLYSGASGLLTGNGYHIECNIQDLAGIDLPRYGVVILAEWSAAKTSYNQTEADQLQSYVKQGGSLLILADNPDTSKNVGPVAARFGVSVGNNPPILDVSNFSGHLITQGITSLKFYFNGGTLKTANMDQVIASSSGHPAIAAIDNLPGRVVIIGDANLFDNRGLEHSDNKLFLVNLFRWLCRQSEN